MGGGVVTHPQTTTGPEQRDRIAYRPSLDGIRGLAVLAVIIYHFSEEWLPGGFLGVDVFFVLSGFLITSLMLMERSRTGSTDMPHFWTRRARRLLPALFLLLTVIALTMILSPAPVKEIRRPELIASLFYVTNWQFISSGVSYFTDFVSASPLRHLWSLAIEEQFYILWPVVFVAAMRQSLKTLVVVVVVGFAASLLLLSILYDPVSPTRAYFGTDSRIHEILGGVLLALAAHKGLLNTTLSHRIARVSALPLLTLLALMVFLDDSDAFYYQGGTLLVTVAVVMLIAATEVGSPVNRLLSFRPLVLLGVVSYGAYLWHWPVSLWITPRVLGASGFSLFLLRFAATIAITAASYLVVERPIRSGRLGSIELTPRVVATGGTAAGFLVLVVILVGTAGGEALPEWAQTPEAVQQEPEVVDLSPVPTTIPIVPQLDDLDPLAVAVVGDSVAVSLLPGLRSALPAGVDLIEAAVPACPVGLEPLYDLEGNLSPYAETCNSTVESLQQLVVSGEADVVLWHDLQSTLARRSDSDELLLPGTPAWETDLHGSWDRALDRLTAGGARVVVLLPPLRSQSASGGCDSSRCEDIQAQDTTMRSVTLSWIETHADDDRVVLVRVDDLVCSAGYPCPVEIDGVQVRAGDNDRTHFTEEGSGWLAPTLLYLLGIDAPSDSSRS